MFSGVFLVPYYTIPKIKRELKLYYAVGCIEYDYTIPKIKRELKHVERGVLFNVDYTIPKIKRELKRQPEV